MVKQHIVKSFDQELTILNEKLMEMGRSAEIQLTSAVEALTHRNVELAKAVIQSDQRENELQREIDSLTVFMLAKRQPLAVDLRSIISALKIATDLERIADNAKRIARCVSEINNINIDKPVESIIEMATIGLKMLREIMEAYSQTDVQKAVEIWHRDEQIDSIYSHLLTQMQTFLQEDSNKYQAYTSLIFMARCCERIGDHIQNIAEDVYYIVKGKVYSRVN